MANLTVISCHNRSAQNCQNSCSKCAPGTRTQVLRRQRISLSLQESGIGWECEHWLHVKSRMADSGVVIPWTSLLFLLTSVVYDRNKVTNILKQSVHHRQPGLPFIGFPPSTTGWFPSSIQQWTASDYTFSKTYKLTANELTITSTCVDLQALLLLPARDHIYLCRSTSLVVTCTWSHLPVSIYKPCSYKAYFLLASRLESQFCVVGAASGWLRSYLRGRQQFVRLGRRSSPMTQCDCGVIIIIITKLTNSHKEWPVVYSCKEWIK